MEEAKPISIHLVIWNQLAYLPEFFAALDTQTRRDFQTVVVDNAAQDGVADWLQANRRDAVALRNFRNLGLARGHNQAIALALSRWPAESLADRFIVLAHPDVLPDPNSLEQLLRAFRRDPELMVAGPRVMRAETHFSTTEDKTETELTLQPDASGSGVAKGNRPIGLSDAFVMFRASLFSIIKVEQAWLDERLPEAFVLPDIFWRCHWLGQKLAFVNEAQVWHHAHGSPPTVGQRFGFWMHRLRARDQVRKRMARTSPKG